MRIAFYAPLKSPNHPVVSGDREMARLLMRALEMAGHEVTVASELRAYLRTPDKASLDVLKAKAAGEIDRLSELHRDDMPDLWFTYHPYYKSPDLLGPMTAGRFGIPYLTVEASLSSRRNDGAWAHSQQIVAGCVRMAAANICLTKRDREGLAIHVPEARLFDLPPFIDATPWASEVGPRVAGRLVTVAMMREGDKLASYRLLAEAFGHMDDEDWTLDVVGDGECRQEVEAMLNSFDGRVTFHGKLDAEEIRDVLRKAGTFVWPGCGEAYGIAYLEAQAAGLPVVAQDSAGVPEVVRKGETGLLTPEGDANAFADAIRQLIHSPDEHSGLARNAARFVADERSLEIASEKLNAIVCGATGGI